jgi:hypothetical protein
MTAINAIKSAAVDEKARTNAQFETSAATPSTVLSAESASVR